MTETPTTSTAEIYADIQVADMQVIEEALQLIDGALGGLSNRELVSSGEVTDVLLDVRSKLIQSDKTEGKDATGLANSSAPAALA